MFLALFTMLHQKWANKNWNLVSVVLICQVSKKDYVSIGSLLLWIFSKRWLSAFAIWGLQKAACYFWHPSPLYLFTFIVKNTAIYTFRLPSGMEICLIIYFNKRTSGANLPEVQKNSMKSQTHFFNKQYLHDLPIQNVYHQCRFR